jgi:electron transfer flavoprotein beta subunit
MLIVTCFKQVPDTTQVKVDTVTGTLISEGDPQRREDACYYR